MRSCAISTALISTALLFGCGGSDQVPLGASINVESDITSPPSIDSNTYYGNNTDRIHSNKVIDEPIAIKAGASIGGINYVAPDLNDTNALDYVVLKGEINASPGKCYDSRRESASSTLVRGLFLPCVTGKNEQLIKLIARGQTSGGNPLYQLGINTGALCIQPNGPTPLTVGMSVIAGNCGRADNADVWIEHEDGLLRSAVNTSLCLTNVNDQLFVVSCNVADAPQRLSFSNYLEEIGLMYKAWGGFCLSTGTSPTNLRGTYQLAVCDEYDQAQRIGSNDITSSGRPVLQGGFYGHRCMATAGGSLAAGNYFANGELCDGSGTRSWYFDASGKLRSADTSLCGGVEGTTPVAGAKVVLQQCSSAAAQTFSEFLPIGPTD